MPVPLCATWGHPWECGSRSNLAAAHVAIVTLTSSAVALCGVYVPWPSNYPREQSSYHISCRLSFSNSNRARSSLMFQPYSCFAPHLFEDRRQPEICVGRSWIYRNGAGFPGVSARCEHLFLSHHSWGGGAKPKLLRYDLLTDCVAASQLTYLIVQCSRSDM